MSCPAKVPRGRREREAWQGGQGVKSEMHKLNQKCLFGVSLIANVNWMLPFTTFSFSSTLLWQHLLLLLAATWPKRTVLAATARRVLDTPTRHASPSLCACVCECANVAQIWVVLIGLILENLQLRIPNWQLWRFLGHWHCKTDCTHRLCNMKAWAENSYLFKSYL